MRTDRKKNRKRSGRFELLESRRVLSASAVGLTGSGSGTEFRLGRSDFEQHLQSTHQFGDFDYSEVVYRATLEAGTFPDSPAQRVDPNLGGDFGGVGSLRVSDPQRGSVLCTGSVIGSSHVLAAAHCFDADNDGQPDPSLNVTFFLNNGGSPSSTINVKDIVSHPDFGGFTNTGANDDLAVLTLSSPVPPETPHYSLRGSEMSAGETIVLVGYGGSGQGDVPGTEVFPDFSVKRSGKNQVDMIVIDEDTGNGELFLYDFDGPTGTGTVGGTTLGNGVETVVRGGDSGSPAFIGGAIAGVNTFEFSLTDDSGDSGEFGVLGGGVVVGSDLASWISSIVGAASLKQPQGGVPEANITTTTTALEEGGSNIQVSVARSGDLSTSLAVEYEVGGTASTNDYVGLPGIAIIPAGLAETEISILAVDDTLKESTETIVITLLPNDSYSVGDSSLVAVNLVDNDGLPDVNIPDDPNAPVVSIRSSPSAVSEGSGRIRVSLVRVGEFGSDLEVRYTVDGTATPGSDYLPLSGRATIPAGTPFGHIDILAIDDSIRESTELISIALVPDNSYARGRESSVTVSILDNDAPVADAPSQLPVVEIAAAFNSIGEGSSSQITISRAGDLSSPLTVKYTIGGSATPGSDFSELSGIVTIPSESSTTQFGIFPINDSLDEANESVVLTLLPSPNYSVGADSDITVTIIDDDEVGVSQPPQADLPSVSIITDPTSTQEGSTGERVIFSRSGSLASPLVIRYSVSGTATPGRDYASLSGVAIIRANTPFAEIHVVPFSDSLSEPTESVVISVAPDASYNLGSNSRTTIQIVDNSDGTAANPGINVGEDEQSTSLPKVSVVTNRSSVDEGSSGVRFTIARDGSLSDPLVVRYSTSGTATAGRDYAKLSGVATIPAGVPFVSVAITPFADNLDESNETLTLSLENSSSYSLSGASSASVTLSDNSAATASSVVGRVQHSVPTSTRASDNQYQVGEKEAASSRTMDYQWIFKTPVGNSEATFVIEMHNAGTIDSEWVDYLIGAGSISSVMISISNPIDVG